MFAESPLKHVSRATSVAFWIRHNVRLRPITQTQKTNTVRWELQQRAIYDKLQRRLQSETDRMPNST